MLYWKHRTNKGRVVYDRPKNPFKYRDAHRIVKSLEEPTPFIDAREFYWLLRLQVLVNRRMALVGARSFLDLLSAIPEALDPALEVVAGAVNSIEFLDQLKRAVR